MAFVPFADWQLVIVFGNQLLFKKIGSMQLLQQLIDGFDAFVLIERR